MPAWGVILILYCQAEKVLFCMDAGVAVESVELAKSYGKTKALGGGEPASSRNCFTAAESSPQPGSIPIRYILVLVLPKSRFSMYAALLAGVVPQLFAF